MSGYAKLHGRYSQQWPGADVPFEYIITTPVVTIGRPSRAAETTGAPPAFAAVNDSTVSRKHLIISWSASDACFLCEVVGKHAVCIDGEAFVASATA